MSRIAQILPVENILLDLEVSSKKRVFEQIGLLIENRYGVARARVYDSLFAREKLGSTGLGRGVAIPHGRVEGLKEAIGVFAKPRTPIPFDAPDGAPVSLLFALLVPEQATDLHLLLLAELAQLFSKLEVREALLRCQDAAGIHQILTQRASDAAHQHPGTV
jgi:nitrogen PTS system EIIA component